MPDTRVTATTKVISTEGLIDDETAIPHVGVHRDPNLAVTMAFEDAADYIATQYEGMGTDTFDITVEIAPVRRDVPPPRTDFEPAS
jgi:hypothetical protein